MRLELALNVPAGELERQRAHQMICDALCEYTVHVVHNNVDPKAAKQGAVGLDGTGRLLCRNGVEIVEQLVASS